DGGPRHVPMGFTSGLIVDDDFHYRKPIMYHYIGHISKYIAPGAKRIGWSKYGANLDVTAAVNPDGSYVVILLNRTKEDSGSFLRVNGHIMRVDLPAETLSTVVIEK
ncbi:MAG TPA: glycoside hydrolase, partial [Lachnospiraceae bacterium]|nr:glycoside hydrolase [Lachnospiraceae bacterium]